MTIKQTSKTFLSVMALTAALLTGYSNQEAYFIRGQINLRKPDWISALNDFRKILELNPNSIDAQTMLGYMESGSGNHKTAIERKMAEQV